MEVREPSVPYAIGEQSTAVGAIPVDWSCGQLGDVCEILTGFPFPSAGYSDSGTRLLRGSNVKRGRIEWHDELTEFWPNVTGELKKYLLKAGDVVVAMDGSLVGRSFGALTEQDVPALLLQRVARIRSNRVEVGYLQHWVCSERFTAHCDAVKTTTAIPHISPGDIRSFKVAIPPSLSEQRDIAIALTDTDVLIDSLEQLLTKKCQIKQGVMQELFNSKTLGGGQFLKLEQISSFITKGATPTTYGFEWESEGILFLRSECVSNNGLDLTQSMFISKKAHAALARSAVVAGDLLLTITGNVGRVVRATNECNINQHISRIRIIDPRVNPDFVYHHLSRNGVRKDFERITTGQAYPQLSLRQVRECVINFPSLARQDFIAATLSDMDTDIAALEARLNKVRALKQAMAQVLLTGRIRLVEPNA